jgi:vacuolar-type H+-ATPase subunit H
MKSNDPLLNSLPQVDAVGAINRVLEAEQMAREAMQECDRQAEAMLRDARERARRIGQRAEQRIQLWYLNSDRRAEQRLSDLDRQAQACKDDPLEPTTLSAEWRRTVEWLADELIGPPD